MVRSRRRARDGKGRRARDGKKGRGVPRVVRVERVKDGAKSGRRGVDEPHLLEPLFELGAVDHAVSVKIGVSVSPRDRTESNRCTAGSLQVKQVYCYC